MTIELDGPLLLVGAGNIGGALLDGWLDRGFDTRKLIVLDPSPPPRVAARLETAGVRLESSLPLVSALAAMILAVKPQIMDAALPLIAPFVPPDTLIVSLAAGRRIESIARHFPPGTAIVRAMPNTPAAVGRGMTVLCKNAGVTGEQAAMCEGLMEAAGETAWIENEALMDAVTAVSGSGPAYVFLLAECLAEAGRAAGLDADLATRLARATVTGAGEMLHQSNLDAADLRRGVTSPGGTTAAALGVLMAPDGLQKLLTEAVAAATARGRALGA